MPVFSGGRILVVFGQQKRLFPQVVPADRGELRIGVSGRQDRIEPVAADSAIGEIRQIRIAVNDVEYEVQFPLFQVHQKIQVRLTEQLKFDGRVLEIEVFDQRADQ